MVNTKAIKIRMMEAGYTTAKLAEKVGVTPNYMSSLVSGYRPLTLKTANLIQEALEIPDEKFVFYFMGGEQ